jgi:hypothetical protein
MKQHIPSIVFCLLASWFVFLGPSKSDVEAFYRKIPAQYQESKETLKSIPLFELLQPKRKE